MCISLVTTKLKLFTNRYLLMMLDFLLQTPASYLDILWRHTFCGVLWVLVRVDSVQINTIHLLCTILFFCWPWVKVSTSTFSWQWVLRQPTTPHPLNFGVWKNYPWGLDNHVQSLLPFIPRFICSIYSRVDHNILIFTSRKIILFLALHIQFPFLHNVSFNNCDCQLGRQEFV